MRNLRKVLCQVFTCSMVCLKRDLYKSCCSSGRKSELKKWQISMIRWHLPVSLKGIKWLSNYLDHILISQAMKMHNDIKDPKGDHWDYLAVSLRALLHKLTNSIRENGFSAHINNYGTLEESLLHLLRMRLYDKQYPFGQLMSAVPAMPPPSFLPTPVYLLWGQNGKKKTSRHWKHCLATDRALVLSALLDSKYKTVQAAMKENPS